MSSEDQDQVVNQSSVQGGVSICSLSSLAYPSDSFSQDINEDATTTTAANVTISSSKESEEGILSQEKESCANLSPQLPCQKCNPLKSPEENDVGRKVEVFWPEENAWYGGVIDKFRDAQGVIVRTLPANDVPSTISEDTERTVTPDEDIANKDSAVRDSTVDTVEPKVDTGPKAGAENAIEEVVTPIGRPSYHISYDDGDEEWIDGDDLIALVYDDMNEHDKQLRQIEVQEALASLVKKKKAKKPRAPRKPKASSTGGSAKGKGKAKAKAVPQPAKPLPPDVLLRVNLNEKKMSAVLDDLSVTRKLVLAHHRRHYDSLVHSRTKAKEAKPSKETENSVVTTTTDGVELETGDEKSVDTVTPEMNDSSSSVQPPEPACGFDEASVQCLVALTVQDSTSTLSSLVESLVANLRGILACESKDPALWQSKYCDVMTLTEYIKSIATRTTYGFRSNTDIKQTSLFEDEAPLALWRWEVLKLAEMAPAGPIANLDSGEGHLSERESQRLAFQTAEALKNIKYDYQRAGKVIKSVQRVIAELHKAAANSTISAGAKAKAIMVGGSTLDPSSEVTIAGLEDKVTKCQADVQKALERKQQAEKKWETSLDEIENKERKRQEEAERKLLLKQKKQELQQAQLQLKLSKSAATEEAKQAKAALVALQNENKRKAKEEADEEARKKAKVLSEKEMKAQTLLNRQKNLMSSFFRSTSAPNQVDSSAASAAGSNICSPATSAGSGHHADTNPSSDKLKDSQSSSTTVAASRKETTSDGSPQSPIVLDSNTVDLTTSSTGSCTAKILPTRKPQKLTAAAALIKAAREKRPLNVEEFENSIAASTVFSMGDICRLYRSRYAGKSITKKKLRKPKKLMIMVNIEQSPVFVPGEGLRGPSAFEIAMGGGVLKGFGEKSYSEEKEVMVDSRKRLFSFSEDLRPPYYGTWSKKSLEVTGRRPFAKDMSNNTDYDVDSEAEWEEEEEGEDIIMSDDEDEIEGNDIVYDEFFCPDDEIVYADQRGGDVPDPTGGKGGVDSVNAIFSAMQAQSGNNTELHSCIAGVKFFASTKELKADASGANNDAVLQRYRAVVDPCSYWSPLPESKAGAYTSVQSLTPSRPPLVLTTPSLTAAANAVERAMKGDIASSAHKKEKKEKNDKIDHRQFHSVLLPCLASFLHGRNGGLDKSVDAFVTLWTPSDSLKDTDAAAGGTVETSTVISPPDCVPVPPSKAQIRLKIKEIAKYVLFGKVSRWVVHPDVLAACPADVAEKLSKVVFPSEITEKPVNNNKVLSFPVVSATEAIESMVNVNVSVPVVAAASTPSKEKEKCKDKDKDNKGQASLLTFFIKPHSSPECDDKAESETPSVNTQREVHEDVEPEEVYDAAQKGITWWGESKEGNSPNTFKRKAEEASTSAGLTLESKSRPPDVKKKKI